MAQGNRYQVAIMDMVGREGRARIAELANALAVSDETIRRHIRPLVETGQLRKVHGSVALAEPGSEPPFHRRLQAQSAAKTAIAREVAALVPDGATVMLDTGSTTAFVAEALAQRSGLTVITNGLEIARALVGRNGHQVYLAGGELKAELAAAVGPEALAFLESFRADLAILSIAGIDAAEGLMNFELDEARIARAMMARASRIILAADASKFGTRAAVRVAPLDRISTLVTDRSPPWALSQRLDALGVEVKIAT